MENQQLTSDVAIKRVKLQIETIKVKVSEIQVISDESKSTGIDILSDIKKNMKTVEEKRKEYKQQYLDKCRDIDELAKKFSIPLNDMYNSLNKKLIDYHTEQKKIEVEAERKRQQEFEKKEAEKKEREAKIQAEIDAVEDNKEKLKLQHKLERSASKETMLPVESDNQVESKTKTDKATMSYTSVWKFKVDDKAKVPMEYLIPDEVKIGKMVRAGLRELPGVTIWEHETSRMINKK